MQISELILYFYYFIAERPANNSNSAESWLFANNCVGCHVKIL